jgi:CheY-like chemotaxis protein
VEAKPRKKILIVDNNEPVRGTIERVLGTAGSDTRTTWSGREALELLGSEEFDVLLVDDYLPDLHCSEFLSRVGKLPSSRGSSSCRHRCPPPRICCGTRRWGPFPWCASTISPKCAKRSHRAARMNRW